MNSNRVATPSRFDTGRAALLLTTTAPGKPGLSLVLATAILRERSGHWDRVRDVDALKYTLLIAKPPYRNTGSKV